MLLAIRIINGCPQGFARMGMHCANFYSNQMVWSNGVTDCQSIGGVLAGVKNQDMYDQLMAMV